MQPFDSVDRLEQAQSLDRINEPLAAAVRKALAPRAVRNLLHGVPLGHSLHPALVLLPVGAWTSASILDLVPRTGPAVPALIATGIVSAVPTAAAGLADWAEQHPEQQRVGLVHAGLNTVALGLYASSLLARARGRRVRGRGLGFAGLGTLLVSGFLGGHLSYRQASGANHAEEVPHLVPPGWHDLGAVADLPVGTPVRRDLDGVPLLVLRGGAAPGAKISVLADRCSHLSGPLHEGSLLRDSRGRECIQCPWHGTVFRLQDGSVYRGPGHSPQPVFTTRVEGERLLVCLPNAG